MTSRSIHFACFNCISLNMCYDSFPCPNWLMGIHDDNFLTVKLLVTLMPAPCMSKGVPWCCPSYLHRLSLVIYMHFLSVISCLWEENVSDFFSYVPHICTCSVLLERKSIKCMREAYGVITVVAAMIWIWSYHVRSLSSQYVWNYINYIKLSVVCTDLVDSSHPTNNLYAMGALSHHAACSKQPLRICKGGLPWFIPSPDPTHVGASGMGSVPPFCISICAGFHGLIVFFYSCIRCSLVF